MADQDSHIHNLSAGSAAVNKKMRFFCCLSLFVLVLGNACCPKLESLSPGPNKPLTESKDIRLVLIILDGVRVQEFFSGRRKPRYSRYTREERRRRLLPFLWGEVARKKNTLILGDTQAPNGTPCYVNNSYYISLPAYADIFSGVRQESVSNNRFRGRPACQTVMDHLIQAGMREEEFAVFASWQHIENVISRDYSNKIYIDAGPKSRQPRPVWKDARFDRQLQRDVLGYLKKNPIKPRFLAVIYNDTDEWGHIGHYRKYINALKEQDHYIKELYNYLEAQKEYRGRTVYIVSTDHGRGYNEEWTRHGNVKGAEDIWLLVHSPNPTLLSPSRWAWMAKYLRQDCSHTSIGRLIHSLLRPSLE